MWLSSTIEDEQPATSVLAAVIEEENAPRVVTGHRSRRSANVEVEDRIATRVSDARPAAPAFLAERPLEAANLRATIPYATAVEATTSQSRSSSIVPPPSVAKQTGRPSSRLGEALPPSPVQSTTSAPSQGLVQTSLAQRWEAKCTEMPRAEQKQTEATAESPKRANKIRTRAIPSSEVSDPAYSLACGSHLLTMELSHVHFEQAPMSSQPRYASTSTVKPALPVFLGRDMEDDNLSSERISSPQPVLLQSNQPTAPAPMTAPAPPAIDSWDPRAVSVFASPETLRPSPPPAILRAGSSARSLRPSKHKTASTFDSSLDGPKAMRRRVSGVKLQGSFENQRKKVRAGVRPVSDGLFLSST
jgi:hypothetical protein